LQIGLGDGRKLQGLIVGHVGQTVMLDGDGVMLDGVILDGVILDGSDRNEEGDGSDRNEEGDGSDRNEEDDGTRIGTGSRVV